MRQFSVRILAGVIFCALASTALSAPFHWNVDGITRPAGPVVLTSFVGGLGPGPNQYTISGTAQNTGGQTYYDTLLLIQFIYKSGSPFLFTDATDTWSDGSNSIFMLENIISQPPLPVLSMSDTDAPLTWLGGTLAATDTVPYVLIGDIAPSQSINFSWVGQANQPMHPFSITGSFVSITAVPEPATVALLGVGIVGLMVVRRWSVRAKS